MIGNNRMYVPAREPGLPLDHCQVGKDLAAVSAAIGHIPRLDQVGFTTRPIALPVNQSGGAKSKQVLLEVSMQITDGNHSLYALIAVLALILGRGTDAYQQQTNAQQRPAKWNCRQIDNH
jgi:hypothetical protein